jgi:hypothetical protein
MSKIKIGLITTLGTNIGDDFIREGICRLLAEDVFPGHEIEFVPVNKHLPYSVYPSWHPVHLRSLGEGVPVVGRLVRKTVDALVPIRGFSRFESCDLIVQCGAPVFWPGCSRNEWARPIWHEIVGPLSARIPVINLAAGSCYPWERQPVQVEPAEDARYVQAILGYCRLTTVRDRLAQSLCQSVGGEVPRIPCSAFLASGERRADLDDSGYVLINYMEGGGHFPWDQGIDAQSWQATTRRLIQDLGSRHRVAMLCHDPKEFSLARSLAPELPAFFPKTSAEYFECVSRAKFAVCNRMHASVAMAGMGIASLAVCTDTRLLMVAELGLPAHYVKDAGFELLCEQAETLLENRQAEKERLLCLRAATRQAYLSALEPVLSRP